MNNVYELSLIGWREKKVKRYIKRENQVQEVENGDFPADANVAHIAADKLARVQKWLESER